MTHSVIGLSGIPFFRSEVGRPGCQSSVQESGAGDHLILQGRHGRTGVTIRDSRSHVPNIGGGRDREREEGEGGTFMRVFEAAFEDLRAPYASEREICVQNRKANGTF